MDNGKDTCVLPPHNATVWVLSAIVSVGIVISYLPQIVRIITARSSVGLSPWFLFLGTTSSWSATLNVLVLQWPMLACTFRHFSIMSLEYWMGILQTGAQQLMFTAVFICFLAYYRLDPASGRRRSRKQRKSKPQKMPAQEVDRALLHPSSSATAHDSSDSDSDIESFHNHIHRSYGAVEENPAIDHENLATHAHAHDDYHNIPAHMRDILERHLLPSEEAIHGKVGSPQEYRLAKRLALASVWYICLIVCVSIFLLAFNTSRLYIMPWAHVLGVTASLLAMCQYVPQIVYTARARLVRSMSIPMMCIQVPGSALFVYTLGSNVGVTWSTLLPYIIAAALQATLLFLCIAWKVRQHRAGLDDYGQRTGRAALSA